MRRSPLSLLLALTIVSVAQPGFAHTQHDQVAAEAASGELVVLVHGMGRSPVSMLPLQIALERAGYRVMNFGYSSYGPTIADIGAQLGEELNEEVQREPATRIHFVGHSLGNIVIRWMLANAAPEGTLGRMVMLAPPNQGSASADRMTRFVGWLLAPINELKTVDSTVRSMAPPEGIEIAVVAGSDDGKVSVEETCLAGARLHLTVPSAHTFIMLPPSTHEMIELFLRTGEVGETVERVADGVCGAE